jgi:hypothetical protein
VSNWRNLSHATLGNDEHSRRRGCTDLARSVTLHYHKYVKVKTERDNVKMRVGDELLSQIEWGQVGRAAWFRFGVPMLLLAELLFFAYGRNRLVVLTDLWYPGWRAYRDKELLPIARVNHAVRGVFVPAGESLIVFRYEPDSFRWGLRLLLAGTAGLGLWVVMNWTMNRRGKSDDS